MIRRSPLKRSIKPIPRRRSKPRRGPANIPPEQWRNAGYRLWLRENCLCVAGLATGSETCSAFAISDPAHTQNNGRGSKGPDASCAPLCRKHHREYDAGREAFEEKYGVDMKHEAAVHWAVYQLAKECV